MILEIVYDGGYYDFLVVGKALDCPKTRLNPALEMTGC